MSLKMDLPKSWEDWSIVGEEPIGRGSYGTVYKAQREVGDRNVYSAIKVIDIPHDEDELQSIRLEYNDEESVKAYFLDIKDSYVKEIELMAEFRGISNIVSIEDFLVEPKEEIGWRIYIRMEYLEDLRLWIRENELTEEEVIKIASDICNALLYCEKEHIIHRDIKPANILRSPMGNYKLGDFGVAMISKQGSGSYSSKGTFEYMAPEVYKGEHYGMSADIYSLGIVLYWLTNRTHEKNRNRFPFESTYKEMLTYKEKENALTRRMNGETFAEPANASPELSRIILKACAYDPKDRYQSASEMLQDLNGLKTAAADAPASAPREGETSTDIQKSGTPRMIFVIAVVIIAAALILAGLGIGRHFSGNESSQKEPEEAWVAEMTETEEETQEQPTEVPVIPETQTETIPEETETVPVTETQEMTETETETASQEMTETETETAAQEVTETETIPEEIETMPATETETAAQEVTETETETETAAQKVTETETETSSQEMTETETETAMQEITETETETAMQEVTETETERTGLLIIGWETESQSEESVFQRNEETYQEYKQIIDEAIDSFSEGDSLYTVDLVVGQSETPGAAIVWEDIIGYSSDVSVVTVSEEGLVTAVGPGTAYVFLMAEDAVQSANEDGAAPTSQVFQYNVYGEASKESSTGTAGSDSQLALEDLSRQLDEWNSAG